MKTIHLITFYLLTCDFLQAARKPYVKLLPKALITANQKEPLKTEQVICQAHLLCAPRFCWCSCTCLNDTPIHTPVLEGKPAAKSNPTSLPPKSPEIRR